MYELIIFVAGFIFGLNLALALFRYGISYATKLIYRIKENIPLEEIGKPILQEFSGTD